MTLLTSLADGTGRGEHLCPAPCAPSPHLCPVPFSLAFLWLKEKGFLLLKTNLIPSHLLRKPSPLILSTFKNKGAHLYCLSLLHVHTLLASTPWSCFSVPQFFSVLQHFLSFKLQVLLTEPSSRLEPPPSWVPPTQGLVPHSSLAASPPTLISSCHLGSCTPVTNSCCGLSPRPVSWITKLPRESLEHVPNQTVLHPLLQYQPHFPHPIPSPQQSIHSLPSEELKSRLPNVPLATELGLRPQSNGLPEGKNYLEVPLKTSL